MNNEFDFKEYVKLIEGVEQDEVDEEETEESFEEGVGDKSKRLKYRGSKHGKDDLDESEEETTDVEGMTFWEAFEKDSDFQISESNETFCLLGQDTGFHYGTHVTEGQAEAHAEDLRDYK